MGFWTNVLLNVDTWIYICVLLAAIYVVVKIKWSQTPPLYFPHLAILAKPSPRRGGKYHLRPHPPGADSMGERMCREIFEKLLGVGFPKVRPRFLLNPQTRRCLELDGFNPNIVTKMGRGLAWEYDGRQHSQKVPHFHRNDGDFVYQVKKDMLKSRRCREVGVCLIRIPYTVKHEDLEKYIRRELVKILPSN